MSQNKKLKHFQGLLKNHNNQLLILHVNIRGIENNFDSFKSCFCLNENGPDVICMSETHFKGNLPVLDTKKHCWVGFSMPTDPKENYNSYSGVAMYVKSNIRCKERKDLSEIKLYKYSHLWVELIDDQGFQVVVGVVYKHGKNNNASKENPQSDEQAIEGFFEILKKLNTANKKFFVLGDFNVDLFYDQDSYKNKLKDYQQLIKTPTRIEIHQIPNKPIFTLIDHIYSNDENCPEKNAGIFQTYEVSDHFPIYCFVPNQTFHKEDESNVVANFQTLLSCKFDPATIANITKEITAIPKASVSTATKIKSQKTYSLLQNQVQSIKLLVEDFLKFKILERDFQVLAIKIPDSKTTLNQEENAKLLYSLKNVKKSLQEIVNELHKIKKTEEEQLNKLKKEGTIDPSYDLYFSEHKSLLKKISLETQLSLEIHELNQFAFTYFLETAADYLQKIAISVND